MSETVAAILFTRNLVFPLEFTKKKFCFDLDWLLRERSGEKKSFLPGHSEVRNVVELQCDKVSNPVRAIAAKCDSNVQ